ncbi:hypothetical protein BJ165DRAFT_1346442 [Panaeolus papilionaceus]|nr:hypothetical protein BJ165DRAFT_1346442 [Panaeolus papilionaceus]
MPPTYSTYPPSWLTVDPDSPDAITVPVPASEDPPYYFSWYKTPSLRYGSHRVSVTHCVQTVMDYALVTVGPETTLAGKKLFVDDSDSQIQYSGSGWKRNNDVTPGYLINKAMPAYNTSNEATQPGDSFTFSFLGTSVSVYGLFSWQNLSSLILQYELDGDVTSASYPIRPSTLGIHPVQINFPFLMYDHLSPDTHQLKVTVKEISNTTFRFDYITYTPAFTTLASRSTSDNRTVVVAPPPSQNNDDLEVKIIIGSIIGGLALLAISVTGLVWWNRRLNARSHTSPRRGM